MTENPRPMLDRLREIVVEFTAAESHLQAFHDTLGPSLDEGDQQDLPENPDRATALRSDIECILADHVRPAIRELGALLVFSERLPEAGGSDPL